MKNRSISVVIPTYNEKENIKILIEKIQKVFKINKIKSEIIIVDDDSKDKTANVSINLNKKYKNIITIIRGKNKGFAKALYRGMNEARNDLILCMDADLVHDPNEITNMLGWIKNNDIVIGSRYLKDSIIKRPKYRNIFSKTAQLVQNIFLGIHILDTTNNFRLFKKTVFENIKNDLHTDGNVMLLEFLYLANKKRYKIKEIPIRYLERINGESKLSASRESYYFLKRILSIKIKNIKLFK